MRSDLHNHTSAVKHHKIKNGKNMYFDRVRSGTCEIKLPLFLFGFLSYELNFKKLLGSAGSFGNLWVALALFQIFCL